MPEQQEYVGRHRDPEDGRAPIKLILGQTYVGRHRVSEFNLTALDELIARTKRSDS